MAPPQTPAQLLRDAVIADPARPALTFYDDALGERVELSYATLDNWVAKTANLLRDELAVDAGAVVRVVLPVHWQAAVWLLAGWTAGALLDVRAVGVASPDGHDVVVCGADDLRWAGAAEGVVALSLRPLGGASTVALPPGVLDYDGEVLGRGDRFLPQLPADPAAPALRTAERTWAAGELLRQAGDLASAHRLDTDARVLSLLPYDGLAGVVCGLLAPVTAAAGVVLCRHAERLDPPGLAHRVETERVTATVGIDAPGVRRIG